jgi:hypothetical protein
MSNAKDKLKTGDVRMEHKPKCEKHKKYVYDGCQAEICEEITVRVPIEVSAHSEVCEVQFDCMDYSIDEENHGRNRFNVIQKMNLRIPLKFVAECDVGEGHAYYNAHKCHHRQED